MFDQEKEYQELQDKYNEQLKQIELLEKRNLSLKL